MTEFLYARLIDDVCAHEGLTDPRRVHDSGMLLIDGHAVSLMHDALIDPGALYITIDFGALPEEQMLQAYRAMLETNLMLAAFGAGALAVDPANGNPVFAGRVALTPELTGAQFAEMLRQCVGHAQQWQRELAASAFGK
jgi:hypothetical protein